MNGDRIRMRTRVALLVAALCAALAGAAHAQTRPPGARTPPAGRAQAESTVVGVAGATIGGTYLRIAADLANALNGPDLRVVPIVGQGSVQNLDDLLNLRGVDAAIVQADALAYVRRERLLPPGADRAIQYVAKLYDEEVHVVAGHGVRTLDDLRGKTVNADLTRSGSALTARLLFDALGIPVTFNDEPQDVGIERLKRGEIDAVLRVVGKPAGLFASLPADAGLHFLALPQDDERLLQTYAPGGLTHADYPNLVAPGQTVDTLTVGAVLAVYAWPQGSARHRQVSRFVSALFAGLDRLQQPPAHPKWREVNLAAGVPGWTRFAPAAAELERLAEGASQREFESFLASGPGAANLTPQQRAALFEQFVRWRRGERP